MDEDILTRMNDNQDRDQMLEEFNSSTLDPLGPVEGESVMKVFLKMNAVLDELDVDVKSRALRADML